MSENVWTSATPTIATSVSGGGPTFDAPWPETTDDDSQEEAQNAWFDLLVASVGA